MTTVSDAENVREQRCDVVVVGAGMAGLVAGSSLAPDRDVVVLEATGRPGGRVESVRHGDYWVNVGTQFAEGSGALFDIMGRHQVKRGSLIGKKGSLAIGGRIVSTDNPAWLVLRSRLPLRARVDLARLGLRIRRAQSRLVQDKNREDARAFRDRLDNQSAMALIDGIRSEEVRTLFRVWSGQWLGCEPEETAATQLVFSIGTALEKASAVPNFSLPVGGNQTLVDLLAADLGDRLRLDSPVERITWTDDEVTVDYRNAEGPARIVARRAVVATTTDRAAEIMPELPAERRAAFDDIAYGRYVVVGFFTDEQGPQRWDDYYGISTPLDSSFQMVFNHAAALRNGPRKPGGALVCLSGGGPADEQFALSDAEIEESYTRDLLRLFPELKGHIERTVVRRHQRVVPFWAPGKRSSLRGVRAPLGPVHFAGDYLLGVPSLADAAASGENAAAAVQASLGE